MTGKIRLQSQNYTIAYPAPCRAPPAFTAVFIENKANSLLCSEQAISHIVYILLIYLAIIKRTTHIARCNKRDNL